MKKLLCVLFAMLMLFAFAACGAETEPVRPENGTQKTPAASTVVDADVTTSEPVDGDPVIIKVSVYHGDGEISENRFSAVKGESLAATLLERVFITEDMNTVDFEYANPDLGNSWSLYVDGVFTTEPWDTILVDAGVEYTFEFTSEIEVGEGVEETVEEGAIEEEPVGEPDITEPETES